MFLVRRSVLGVSTQTRRSVSAWSAVVAGPPDPILGKSISACVFPLPTSYVL